MSRLAAVIGLLLLKALYADERVDKLFSDLQSLDRQTHEASYVYKAKEAQRLFTDLYLKLTLPLDQDFVFEPEQLSKDLIKEWGDKFQTLSEPIRIAIQYPTKDCIKYLRH